LVEAEEQLGYLVPRDSQETQDWPDHGVHLEQLVHLASQAARDILVTLDVVDLLVFPDPRVILVKLVSPEPLDHPATLHQGLLEQLAHPAPLAHQACLAL